MIHCFKQNGNNIVMDIYSGAIHIVDDAVYDLVQQVKPPLDSKLPDSVLASLGGKYSEAELDEAYAEILELYNSEALFAEDDYAQFEHKLGLAPVKAMCLHISHDCNLKCEYCFAGEGNYGGEKVNMPADVGKKAVDFLIEQSGTRRNLEIDFFGGEPLMNWETVKAVVDYARSREAAAGKNFRFTITTNGLLLDEEKIDYINREMYNAVLSIDGRPDVHNKVRKSRSGMNAYDVILSNFQRLVAGRGDAQYYVRGTFTKYNLDFASDVMYLAECGFDQISVEPVVGADDAPYSITEAELPAVCAEYERLASMIIEQHRNGGRRFNFFHFMMDTEQGPCAIKRMRGCGAGNEYLAITPSGDVYPCHQFVGDKDFKMGNLSDGNVNMPLKHTFANIGVHTKTDCKSCWAKFYCSGGCSANAAHYGSGLMGSHNISCELEKKRIECAIAVKAAMLES